MRTHRCTFGPFVNSDPFSNSPINRPISPFDRPIRQFNSPITRLPDSPIQVSPCPS